MKFLYIYFITVLTVSARDEEALTLFIDANNGFASSLYQQIAQIEKSNFFTSPYSIEAVLAFTQSGAKDETSAEIRNILHLPENQTQIERSVKASISILQGNELYSLNTANKMYVQEGFVIKDEFKKSASDIYNAGIENIDFSKNENAAKTINEWVEDRTNKKIKDLIIPQVLNTGTRTILINTLYFKGNWSRQFKDVNTEKRDFYKLNNEVSQVDTMQDHSASYNYHECQELDSKFLELPFLGEDVTMVIVLPNQKDGITKLENQVDKVFLPTSFKQELVNVALPKFKIESTIQLTDVLQKLGIKKVFSPNEADLSGIAGKKGELSVSKVVQKTYIDVKEGGVEAAAATYIAGFGSAFLPEQIQPKEFNADHPFLFYIKAKGIVIFVGRVADP